LRSHRWILLVALVLGSIVSPPRPHASACKEGPVEPAPFDLEVSMSGPAAPKLVSILHVKPASQIGCTCRPDCVDDLKIEFTLETTAQRAYVLGAGRAFFLHRAEDTPDDAARFYISPGQFPGGAPPSFRVSVVDEAGHRSEAISVEYDKTMRAEPR
jgi:hypothetical protein